MIAPFLSRVGVAGAILVLLGACGGPADEDTTPRVQLPGAPAVRSDPNPYDPGALPPAPSADGSVVTYAGTELGATGLSVNGRINPRGAPTDYYFEYGPTTAYGRKTPVASLGPQLAAHYTESFDSGPAGWRGGSGTDLAYVPTGGAAGTGFVRYTEPTGDDYNHVDGIGKVHLVKYFYPGTFDGDAPTAAFGGGDPDLRDAKVDLAVRGKNFAPGGSELVWWSQIDQAHGMYKAGEKPRYSNWAHTGFFLTDRLLSGQWESVSYRLWNDTTEWTYAGTNRELNIQLMRDSYVYAPLDDVLHHLDTDFFHLLAYIDNTRYPTGAIEFDDLAITYRNHSLVLPSNGGKLASAPAGSPDDPAVLSDGWRIGAGKTWRSAPSPSAPLEIVYDFEAPVVIQKVQLHQHPQFPSKDVEVFASSDGTTWTSVVADVIPRSHPAGPNFAYLLAKDLVVDPARKLKVRITSGYQPDAWGLGEIEVFGTGAKMKTDDDFYRLNADITGLAPGDTIHYRLVALKGGETVIGGDQVYTVPRDARPYAVTGTAQSQGKLTKLNARINTLGAEGQVYFEFGLEATYGGLTPTRRVGPEVTPRTTVLVEELGAIPAGKTVHYRVVVQTAAGATHGNDATFVSQ